MSFAEKVHARLVALESQVQALDKRLKALEKPIELPVVTLPLEINGLAAVLGGNGVMTRDSVPIKRGPGRPKKVANG